VEKIEELVGDDCGFESHGTVLVAENERSWRAFAPRRRSSLEGFTHEELIDRAELKRLVPASPTIAGRRGLATRRRRRSVPHHPGVP